MPNWTKKNFGDLRDVSPHDAHVQWRFAREPLRSPELGVSRFTYDPGARMPWGHRHRVQEEAYVVVAALGTRTRRVRVPGEHAPRADDPRGRTRERVARDRLAVVESTDVP
jgi:mannose-6-phosphate isomerase-like protein (cupin superfamily)